MRVLRRAWSILHIVIKRLLSRRGLALATALGLVAAVALILSVPLYVDAVYYRTFQENLIENRQTGEKRSYSPFTFIFRYNGGAYGALQWEEVQQVDEYLSSEADDVLGLTEEFHIRYLRTEPFAVFPEDESAFKDPRAVLHWSSFIHMSDFEEHIMVLEGRYPAEAETGETSIVEVMVGESLAMEMGLQVDETYLAFTKDVTQTGEEINTQIPLRISGIWKPIDAQGGYWSVRPSLLEEMLFVPEGTFLGRIAPYLSDEVYTSMWYLEVNGSDVRSSDAELLLRRITTLKNRAATLLPGLYLDVSPEEALLEYRRSARTLTILLYAFSIPIAGLMFAFINLVSGLSIEERRNEIAVLRSRGGTLLQIIGMVALEAILLGVVALALSLPVGRQIAGVIGRTRSFLDFTELSALPVSYTTSTVRVGLAAILLAVAAQVVPAFQAARHTIVTYKQERARMLRPPWWQRVWLDALLMIPAGYGAYLLRQQGSIAVMGEGVNYDPFQNPLLFLVPALGLFALTLFFLRLMPLIMRLISWFLTKTKSVGMMLAVRHLARSPGFYNTPLILLVLTLSLSAFTASLAETLDDHLYAQTYYQVGADLNFLEIGAQASQATYTAEGLYQADSVVEGPRWLFFPVSEYQHVPGVYAATRVGRYSATPQFEAGSAQEGIFLGIDRVDFPKVAFWREDFAPESLGALMNRLAIAQDGVLVPYSFMAGNSLSEGDTLPLLVDTYGQRNEMDLRIVGGFDLFPTWYPEDGPIFVGNLESLFEQAGGQFPYQIWLKTDPKVEPQQIGEEGLRRLNVRVYDWESSQTIVVAEQQRPERQGLLGLLSVGFAAAGLLTVVGFLLYSLFSFRRRFIELGVLRASGLSSSQMTSFLTWELFFLILMGGGVGTSLGAFVSEVFIPYLQVGVDPSARIPPFRVAIAWEAIFQIYALFGVLFVITLVALILLLRRMRIYQAIKLGETV